MIDRFLLLQSSRCTSLRVASYCKELSVLQNRTTPLYSVRRMGSVDLGLLRILLPPAINPKSTLPNFQSPLRCGSIPVCEDSCLIGCHLHLYLTDAVLYMLPCVAGQWWARQGSNLRPIGYEPTALPLSYRPGVSIIVSQRRTGCQGNLPYAATSARAFVITDGCS